MKKHIAYIITASTLAIAPLALNTGCAVTQGRESASAYAKDKEIATRIKADFYADKTVKGTKSRSLP